MTFHENVKKFDAVSVILLVPRQLGHIQPTKNRVNY